MRTVRGQMKTRRGSVFFKYYFEEEKEELFLHILGTYPYAKNVRRMG